MGNTSTSYQGLQQFKNANKGIQGHTRLCDN